MVERMARQPCHPHRSGNSKGLRSSVRGTGGKDLFGLFQCIYIILREQSCCLLAELLVGWNNRGEAASSHDVSAGSPNLSGNGRADRTPPRLAWVGIEVEPGARAGVAQPGWTHGRPTGLLVISSWIHTVGWERLELREWLNPKCLDLSLSKAPAASPCLPSHLHVLSLLGLKHCVSGTSPLLLPTVRTSSLLSSSQGHLPIHSLIHSSTKLLPSFRCLVLASLNWTNYAPLPTKGATQRSSQLSAVNPVSKCPSPLLPSWNSITATLFLILKSF